ncbi:MAG: LamG domain-containing protein [Phycisphaerae bacterium]
MNRSRPCLENLWFLPFAAAAVVVGSAHQAAAETVRSTHYSGAGGVEFGADERFNTSVAMTLEGWVFREDSRRCETIIAQNSANSFSLGFCLDNGIDPVDRLFFSRNGAQFAFASSNVRANVWTHVAANYDGAEVRFYIDGAPAGVQPLNHSGAGAVGPVIIGAGAACCGFRGRLDEIRMWSVARTQPQIQADMNRELRNAPGLVAAFDTGGPRDGVANVQGTASAAVSTADSAFGILPSELVIPRAAFTPEIDGRIFTSTEYAGAEQMVVRFRHPTDPSRDFDTAALFVRDDDNLYAAVNISRLGNPLFIDPTAVGLFLDPNFSRDPRAQPGDLLITSGATILSSRFRVGDGNGNFVATNAEPPSTHWQTATTNCTGFEIGRATCHEFRVGRTLLGDFNQIDGLALGILDVGEGAGSQLGPVGATRTSPATWAAASYSTNGVALPRVRVSGRVLGYTFPGVGEPLRPATSVTTPLANLPVTLGAGDGSVSYRVMSDANGTFSFDVRVPANVPLGVGVFPSCLSCRMRELPIVTTPPGGVAPTNIRPEGVGFPAQPSGSDVQLANIDFRVLTPAGPLQIGEVPANPSISVSLRADTTIIVPGDVVRINGLNLHDDFEVYLSPFDTTPTEEAWILYPAQIVTRSPDGSFVDVQAPVVPPRTPVRQTLTIPPQPIGSLPTFQINWRWVIKDRWSRPNYRVYTTSGNFGVEPPKDYPKVWGFGFTNGGSGAGLDDFTAVYGFNAYICVDPFGECDLHIPDPIYMGLWLPVYQAWVGPVQGSCNGLSALSLLFRLGFEKTTDWDPNVLFPAGFTSTDYVPVWRRAGFTRPAEPRNLFARIRQLHGVQTSDEFISEFLRDADEAFAWPPVEGEPVERLNEIRLAPLGQVISMMDGTGHVVTPYRVDGADSNIIKVYDNNSPRSLAPEIVVDRAADTYRFDNGSRGGNRIFTFPLSIFQRGRTMPGIEDIVDYMWFFVVGEANVTYSTPDGRRWGRDADGNEIAENPAAIAILPQGQPADGEPRNFPWVLRNGAPDPQIEIRSDGGEVLLHAASGGTILQLIVPDSNAGATDRAAFGRDEAGRAKTLRFAPERSTAVRPRIGMVTGELERIVFEFSGMTLPGGGGGEFLAAPAARGAQFKNEGNAPVTYTLVAQTVDGASGKHGTRIFGPFQVPANSVQRVEIANWPDATQLSSTLDIGADGVDDAIALVDGLGCDTGEDVLPTDTDGDGVPDTCAPSVPTFPVDHLSILPPSAGNPGDGGPGSGDPAAGNPGTGNPGDGAAGTPGNPPQGGGAPGAGDPDDPSARVPGGLCGGTAVALMTMTLVGLAWTRPQRRIQRRPRGL